MHSDERFTESVRMYVMYPDSYSLCATIIVCDTVKPSLRAASCCSVDVVNGAAGLFFSGLVLTSSIVNVLSLHVARNASASSFVLKRFESSVLSTLFSPSSPGSSNCAVTR